MLTLSCSKCHGTIARDIELDASSPVLITFKMAMKCPHCGTPNRVEISTAITRTIKINGRQLEVGTGEAHEEHSPVRTL